jgi:hypothetical protein
MDITAFDLDRVFIKESRYEDRRKLLVYVWVVDSQLSARVISHGIHQRIGCDKN